MRTKNSVVEIVILGILGLLVIFTLLVPQLLREEAYQPLFLSVLLRDADSSGLAAARLGMEQAADELGAELRFLTPTVQGDSREQAELLRREAEGGAHALIAVPADPATLRDALLSSPRPLVTLEAPVEGGAGTVSPDNALLGQALAQALLEDWDSGPVVLLDSGASCPGAVPRLEAALEVLTAAQVPVIRMTGLPEGPLPRRWVMAFEPSATRQAAEKRNAQGLGFSLYGVGSSTAITSLLERGEITAVAAWSDYAAGYLAVQQAVRAVREQSQELELLSFSIVRGEDIYAPENQKLLFPVTS